MKPILLILNPRVVRRFEEHTATLPIDHVRIRAYTEREIMQGGWDEAMDAIRHRGYTHVITTSDDLIIPKDSLELLLRESERDPHNFKSGWANMDEESHLAGLSDSPLTDPIPLGYESYDFPTWRDVLSGPRVRRTYFTGFVGTVAPIDLWEWFPFQCFCDSPQDQGYASDYHLSRRLQEDGVRIDAYRDAFCLHLKTKTGSMDPYPVADSRGIFIHETTEQE